MQISELSKKLAAPESPQLKKQLLDELAANRTKVQNELKKGLNSKDYAKYAKFIEAIDLSTEILNETKN